MKKFSVKTIVAIGIGAALFFVLGRFVAIPSPVPNTNISIQYGLLAFMATVFGPVAGLLIGLIGHALIDFSYGWGIWWSWVIASAVFGLLVAFGTKKVQLDDGVFGKKDAVRFNLSQIVSHLLAWSSSLLYWISLCMQNLPIKFLCRGLPAQPQTSLQQQLSALCFALRTRNPGLRKAV